MLLLVLYVLYLDSALQGGAPFALRWRAAASFLWAGCSVIKGYFKKMPLYPTTEYTARYFVAFAVSCAAEF